MVPHGIMDVRSVVVGYSFQEVSQVSPLKRALLKLLGVDPAQVSVEDKPKSVGRTLCTPDDVPEIRRIAALPREELRDMASTALANLDSTHLFGYAPVAPADAVAELSFPTGNHDLDFIHSALIDCIQHGYLLVVRDNVGILRFGITESGQEHVNKFLGLE